MFTAIITAVVALVTLATTAVENAANLEMFKEMSYEGDKNFARSKEAMYMQGEAQKQQSVMILMIIAVVLVIVFLMIKKFK